MSTFSAITFRRVLLLPYTRSRSVASWCLKFNCIAVWKFASIFASPFLNIHIRVHSLFEKNISLTKYYKAYLSSVFAMTRGEATASTASGVASGNTCRLSRDGSCSVDVCSGGNAKGILLINFFLIGKYAFTCLINGSCRCRCIDNNRLRP